MDIVCLSECLIMVLTAGMFDVYHFFCCFFLNSFWHFLALISFY